MFTVITSPEQSSNIGKALTVLLTKMQVLRAVPGPAK
jgi:hypothetical protein